MNKLIFERACLTCAGHGFQARGSAPRLHVRASALLVRISNLDRMLEIMEEPSEMVLCELRTGNWGQTEGFHCLPAGSATTNSPAGFTRKWRGRRDSNPRPLP